MYKVIIIDDESLIREGLRSIVNWDTNGFEVVGEADDGISGAALVLEENPDLILVDIRMPGQTGLELINEVRSKGYVGKVIILTGYSEFEYAQKAIKLNVTSYLLKPIDEDELEKLLIKIKSDLDQELLTTTIIENSSSLKRIELCQKLIFETPLLEEDKSIIESDQFLESNSSYYTVLISKVEGDGCIGEHFFEDYFSGKVQPIMITMADFYLLVFRNNTMRQLNLILQDLSKKYIEKSKEICFIAVGSEVKGYASLSSSYNNAIRLYNKRFLFRNQPVVFWNNYISNDNECKVSFIDSTYLYGLIEVGNCEAIEVYFNRLEDSFTASDYSTAKIKGICVKGFVEVNEWLAYNYTSLADKLPENIKVVEKIYESAYLSSIISHMKEVFIESSELICDGSSENTMKRLLNYIHNNYSKNLKLEGLARLFNYNSSYLGKIFKENTGSSFNNYLDDIRIEHAKELLKTEKLKVYEISEMIGYGNVDYFYSKFKKYVGMSPKAFMKDFCEDK